MLVLLCPFVPHVRGESIHLSPQVGVGGFYRFGTWFPVRVSLVSTDAPAIDGRVEVFADETALRSRTSSTAPVFAAPFACASGPLNQTVTIYCRGIDPVGDSMNVRLVSGAHGEGSTLAHATMSGAATQTTGVSVSNPDLFVLSISDIPGVFRELESEPLGIAHTWNGLRRSPKGYSGPTGMRQPSIMVGDSAAKDLPDRAAGYAGVDAILLRCDGSLDSLTESQTKAIEDYVSFGGRLIIISAGQAVSSSSTLLEDMAPALFGASDRTVVIAGFGKAAAATLLPRLARPSQTLLAGSDGQPLAVSSSFGAGSVTVVATDLSSVSQSAALGNASKVVWRTLLMDGQAQTTGVLASLAGDGSEDNIYGWAGNQSMSWAVRQSASLDPPGISTVALFLIAYLLAVVPLNFLILKRLDRKELAWITIPVLVVVFASGAYGAGYLNKGGGLFVNRVAIIETSAGSHTAGVVGCSGVFSSALRSYDLRLNDPSAVVTNDAVDSDEDTLGNVGQTRIVETGFDDRIERASIPQWAMRAFDVRTVTDLQGSFDGSLVLGAGDRLSGTVTNDTAYAISDCAIYCRGNRIHVQDLGPGQSTSVNVSLESARADPLLESGPPRNPYGQAPLVVEPGQNRLKDGLAQVVDQSLENGDSSYSTYRGADRFSTYVGRPDEAYLIGWCTDPMIAGSSIQIDGAAPAYHDISLVDVGYRLSSVGRNKHT